MKKKNKLQSLPPRLRNVDVSQRIAASSSWRDSKEGCTARLYGYQWQQYRLDYLVEHALCAIRGEGCELVATVVDHITPHRGDPVLFRDTSNHQPACAHCHNVHKQREEQQGAPRVQRVVKPQR